MVKPYIENETPSQKAYRCAPMKTYPDPVASRMRARRAEERLRNRVRVYAAHFVALAHPEELAHIEALLWERVKADGDLGDVEGVTE